MVWHYARTRGHCRYKHTCSLSLYLSLSDDPQPGPVTGLVNWSRLTQISPANLVMLQWGGDYLELRVGYQYDCTLSDRLPALPLRLSGDCIAEVREK